MTKKIILLLAIFIQSFVLPANTLQDVKQCFFKADFEDCEGSFASQVEINLPSQNSVLPAQKVVDVLNRFLNKYKSAILQIDKEKVNESSKQKFAIGTLITEGKVFKIQITLSTSDAITSIRIL
jgi:hypothetical protein